MGAIRYIFYTVMEFEFDPKKSESNKAKHGVDFVAAQAIWADDERLEVPARTDDEPRTLVIGMAAGKLWSAIVTLRGGKIRLISVRRARKEERQLYES